MCGQEVQKNNATPICFVMPLRERERDWTYECGVEE